MATPIRCIFHAFERWLISRDSRGAVISDGAVCLTTNSIAGEIHV